MFLQEHFIQTTYKFCNLNNICYDQSPMQFCPRLGFISLSNEASYPAKQVGLMFNYLTKFTSRVKETELYVNCAFQNHVRLLKMLKNITISKD